MRHAASLLAVLFSLPACTQAEASPDAALAPDTGPAATVDSGSAADARPARDAGMRPDFGPSMTLDLGMACEPFAPDPGASLTANDIPVAHTVGCGWTTVPAPVLRNCTEPLAPDAADLRGLWFDASENFVARIEQCGNRLISHAANVTHDMRTDGTLENGVNDVNELGCQPLRVSAQWNQRRLELRPNGGAVLATYELRGTTLVRTLLGAERMLQRICTAP